MVISKLEDHMNTPTHPDSSFQPSLSRLDWDIFRTFSNSCNKHKHTHSVSMNWSEVRLTPGSVSHRWTDTFIQDTWLFCVPSHSDRAGSSSGFGSMKSYRSWSDRRRKHRCSSRQLSHTCQALHSNNPLSLCYGFESKYVIFIWV